MAEEAQARSGGGRGVVLILLAGIAAAAVALFVKNLEALLNSVSFFVDMKVVGLVLGVVSLIAAILWIQGHRVYARSKGYSAFLGLVLAFPVIVGLIVLAVLPGPRRPAEAGSEEEAPGGRGADA